jgi:hypothetical protein
MELTANFFYLSLFTRQEAEKHRRASNYKNPLDKLAATGNQGHDCSHHVQRFSSPARG